MSDFTITRPTTLFDTGIKTAADEFGSTTPGTASDSTIVRPGNQYFEQPDADGEWPEFTRGMTSKHYTSRDEVEGMSPIAIMEGTGALFGEIIQAESKLVEFTLDDTDYSIPGINFEELLKAIDYGGTVTMTYPDSESITAVSYRQAVTVDKPWFFYSDDGLSRFTFSSDGRFEGGASNLGKTFTLSYEHPDYIVADPVSNVPDHSIATANDIDW